MRSLFLPLLLVAVAVAAATTPTTAAGRKALVGGWKAITDVSGPHVREIGEYAVSEHNKQDKAGLVFVKVVSGQTQPVAGVNYKLVIEATKGGRASGQYEAVVWEKEWIKFRKLTSFKPLKV